MARGRFLNISIATDIKLNSLSLEAHWLYMMTIPHLDRDGLIVADTYVLFGKVCPRRPELIGRVDALIAEWIVAELVRVYPTPDGLIAYFCGFQKNQIGMTYSRETPSIFDPPPGMTRDGSGLVHVESMQDTCNLHEDYMQDTVSVLPGAHASARAEVELEVKVEVEEEKQLDAAAVDVAHLWRFWESNMSGTRTPVIVDSVNDMLTSYSIGEIEAAITIACKQNKRTIRYVEGILAKGVFTQAATNGYSGKDKIHEAAEASRKSLIAAGKEHLL